MGGQGWRDIQVEQGISHLQRLLHGIAASKPLGPMMRVAIKNDSGS